MILDNGCDSYFRSYWCVGILLCISYLLFATVQFMDAFSKKAIITKVKLLDADNLTVSCSTLTL